MPRDRTPNLGSTCLICRQKLISSLKINCPSSEPLQKWRALYLEAFSMLFGLREDHPLTGVFGDDDGGGGKMCNRCLQDVSNVHYVFWQLQGLEKKLTELQVLIFGRLKINYEALPVDLILGKYMGAEILRSDLGRLNYDEIVKIIFEEIKGSKEAWPKPNHTERWKQACKTAEKWNQDRMDHDHAPESILPDLLEDSEVPVKIEVETGMDTFSSGEYSDHFDQEDHQVAVSNVEPEFGDEESAELEVNIYDDEEMDEESVPRRGRRALKTKPKVKVKQKPENAQFLCTEDPENCSKTYRTKKLLRNHIDKFHKAKKFPCDLPNCSAKFKTEVQVIQHKAKSHSIPLPKVICELCGVALEHKEMRKHFLVRHQGQGKYKCERCSMDFMEGDELQAHETLHATAEYPFLCVVCQQLFTNSMDLKNHVISNHLSSGLKCPICGIMKPNDFQLQRHIKVHDREKRFTCEQCGRQFASRAYLNYHMDHYHINQGRKYPCEICGKEFLHQKNVLRHLISHQEDKPFKCKICPKTFNYSHLLKKHEEIHSGTRKYQCHMCHKRFRQEQNLRQHMKSHQPKPDKMGGGTRKKMKGEGDEGEVDEISYEIHHEEGDNKEQIPVILQVKGDMGHHHDNSGLMTTTAATSTAQDGGNLIEATIIPAAELGEDDHGHPETQYETVQEIQLTAHDLAQSQTVLFVYEYQG